MKNRFMKVNEVAEELEVSIPYAYKIIRKLNEELEGKGYLTVKGRINRDYFYERIYRKGGEN
ncbi:MAG: LysR family transcriptional regulator [Ruminococcaceae bacterium]|nr:LysR family transcriptional regulator [Oscillospiraceae bacterium]MBQ3692641.1 LysR family transcriptional regulator [Clostridia bacterium]